MAGPRFVGRDTRRLDATARSITRAHGTRRKGQESAISRVLCDARSERPTVMNLGPPLPAASNGLPGSRRPKPAGRGGPPHPPLFGLSPSGVCRAGRVTPPAGERLPHRFTLTASEETAVCFLRHFPYPRGRWALPTTLPYGARTFLVRSKPRATVPPTLAEDILRSAAPNATLPLRPIVGPVELAQFETCCRSSG